MQNSILFPFQFLFKWIQFGPLFIIFYSDIHIYGQYHLWIHSKRIRLLHHNPVYKWRNIISSTVLWLTPQCRQQGGKILCFCIIHLNMIPNAEFLHWKHFYMHSISVYLFQETWHSHSSPCNHSTRKRYHNNPLILAN